MRTVRVAVVAGAGLIAMALLAAVSVALVATGLVGTIAFVVGGMIALAESWTDGGRRWWP